MARGTTAFRSARRLVVLGLGAFAACRGAAPGARPAAPAVSRDTGRAGIGDTAVFGTRILDIAYGPDRAIIELTRPAYVVVIAVTDTRIEAIAPAGGKRSQIVGNERWTVSLDRDVSAGGDAISERFTLARPIVPDNATAGDIQEYNRCLARARQLAAARRNARRPIVGRDSAGRPIYGAAPLDDAAGEIDYESTCRVGPSSRPQPGTLPRPAAKAGRYLFVYAADTPVESSDVADLVISEGDPRAIALVMGQKLFGIRGARWSAAFAPW